MFFPGGKTIAVVGPTGSGKSTIIQLVERFYDVGTLLHLPRSCRSCRWRSLLFLACADAGKVSVDSQDVKAFNTKFLRTQMGLVQQEPVLFSSSIKENIRCASSAIVPLVAGRT